jgi:hypothetical protein
MYQAFGKPFKGSGFPLDELSVQTPPLFGPVAIKIHNTVILSGRKCTVKRAQ